MTVEEQSGSRVVDLLDALESVVVGGRRVVFTPNVMVNEDEALDLIDGARHALPEDVKQARHVIERQRELLDAAEAAAGQLTDQAHADADATATRAHRQAQDIVDAARAEAERMLAEARAHAAALVAAHAITDAARHHAAAIEAEAAQRADQFRRDSEDYARELLGGLEQQVAKAQKSLRRATEALPPA
jgi:cell division septum initiation protein DivIVA